VLEARQPQRLAFGLVEMLHEQTSHAFLVLFQLERRLRGRRIGRHAIGIGLVVEQQPFRGHRVETLVARDREQP